MVTKNNFFESFRIPRKTFLHFNPMSNNSLDVLESNHLIERKQVHEKAENQHPEHFTK